MYLKLNFNDDLQNLSKNPEKIHENKTKETLSFSLQKEKIITRSKSKNFEGRKKKREDDSNQNEVKKIRKGGDDFSDSSSISSNSYKSYSPDRFLEFQEDSRNFDIVMMGNLQYRYNLDQLELEGNWGMNNDSARERFSYLFLKKHDKISCIVRKEEIEFSNITEENSMSRDEFLVNICSANLFEIIVIPHPNIFRVLLQFLSGEYHGFFMYYDKTIEDRFMLNFCLEEAQVRISGEGSNNLGNFNLIGYLNFYRTKEEIMLRNDIESEVILLGEFKMSKIYNAFNPNENFRVIKSYQHKKKKSNSDISNN